MIILLIFSTGLGLILSVLEVYFRDIEYIYSVFITLVMYLVPILYPIQTIKNRYLLYVIKINPLYSMIELFRQSILYGHMLSWKMLVYALVSAILVLTIGIIFFNWKSDDIVYRL